MQRPRPGNCHSPLLFQALGLKIEFGNQLMMQGHPDDGLNKGISKVRKS